VSEDTSATARPETGPPADSSTSAPPVRAKRSWKSRLLELVLWALLSIVIAVVMVALSDKLLPNNF
jgi:hypothetical protein